MNFERVLVVGAGQMGGGIAQVVAASGRRVFLYDIAPGAVERGLAGMRKSLEKLAAKRGADPDDVLGRVEPVDTEPYVAPYLTTTADIGHIRPPGRIGDLSPSFRSGPPTPP